MRHPPATIGDATLYVTYIDGTSDVVDVCYVTYSAALRRAERLLQTADIVSVQVEFECSVPMCQQAITSTLT